MQKDNNNKLYLVRTQLGTFYAVAKSFDEAAELVKSRLDKADYGCYFERSASAVELLATESFFAERQSFSDDSNALMIADGTMI